MRTGEMIKSLLNGTDHYCVFNIQPTAVLQMHPLVFVYPLCPFSHVYLEQK